MHGVRCGCCDRACSAVVFVRNRCGDATVHVGVSVKPRIVDDGLGAVVKPVPSSRPEWPPRSRPMPDPAHSANAVRAPHRDSLTAAAVEAGFAHRPDLLAGAGRGRVRAAVPHVSTAVECDRRTEPTSRVRGGHPRVGEKVVRHDGSVTRRPRQGWRKLHLISDSDGICCKVELLPRTAMTSHNHGPGQPFPWGGRPGRPPVKAPRHPARRQDYDSEPVHHGIRYRGILPIRSRQGALDIEAMAWRFP